MGAQLWAEVLAQLWAEVGAQLWAELGAQLWAKLGQLGAELGLEGRAHRAVHQRLQRAEVVHHPPLLLPVRREQQHPKGLQLGTTNQSLPRNSPQFWEFMAKRQRGCSWRGM